MRGMKGDEEEERVDREGAKENGERRLERWCVVRASISGCWFDGLWGRRLLCERLD